MATMSTKMSEKFTTEKNEIIQDIKRLLDFIGLNRSEETDEFALEFDEIEQFDEADELLNGTDFEYDLTKYGNEIIIFSRSSACVCGLSDLLSYALKKNDDDAILSFSFSYSCSPHRIGEFGGGAAIINKSEVIFIDTYQIIRNEKNKLAGKDNSTEDI